jgi:hypothetical protein
MIPHAESAAKIGAPNGPMPMPGTQTDRITKSSPFWPNTRPQRRRPGLDAGVSGHAHVRRLSSDCCREREISQDRTRR